MKKSFVLLSLYLITCQLIAQTAEEVLLKTQDAYRSLDNYVDEGKLFKIYFNPDGEPTPMRDTSVFSLALDRNYNIQFVHNGRNGVLKSGTSYVHLAGDSTGLFKRIGSEDSAMPEIPAYAAARATGRGAPMLFYIGSMFYPDFRADVDSSYLLRYDWANRLTDTIMDGMSCFVVKTGKTNYVSKEDADRQNFRHDSINGLLEMPVEQRGGPRTVPGPRYFETKYYIRKNDLLLVQQVNTQFYEISGAIRSKSILQLNPKTNVEDFKKYLTLSER